MRCVNLHCPGSEAHIGQPEAEASNDSLGPPNLPFADFCNKIGTFETSTDVRTTAALGGNADISQRLSDNRDL
jgi:hypothetical protein